MNDSGFEEDQAQLLADLTSQALIHQPAAAGVDPLETLERLAAAAAASSDVPPSSAAFLYGFTLCIGETVRYLTEEERLPADHPLVLGVCSHLLAEYARLLEQLCPPAGKTLEPAPGALPAARAGPDDLASGAGPPGPTSGVGPPSDNPRPRRPATAAPPAAGCQ
ncbi:uncharacterized protein LOC119101296 [Pollicipes pollicipes]|uniref:uncharacterized protein LOC119101296 n=1 Tax=Pollicipes pollicipes TaxID=41117 RepID=UPI001884E02C|nr:uncharacterized protein LOC119101296 [Pollicipes pollicipes]